MSVDVEAGNDMPTGCDARACELELEADAGAVVGAGTGGNLGVCACTCAWARAGMEMEPGPETDSGIVSAELPMPIADRSDQLSAASPSLNAPIIVLSRQSRVLHLLEIERLMLRREPFIRPVGQVEPIEADVLLLERRHAHDCFDRLGRLARE